MREQLRLLLGIRDFLSVLRVNFGPNRCMISEALHRTRNTYNHVSYKVLVFKSVNYYSQFIDCR